MSADQPWKRGPHALRDDIDGARVRAMVEAGASKGAIATALSLPITTLGRYCQRNGIDVGRAAARARGVAHVKPPETPCAGSKATDWKGRAFGVSVVLERHGATKHGQAAWRMRCGCGKRFVRRSADLATAARRGRALACPDCRRKP